MNLILDFDGTITIKDTIGDLIEACIAVQKTRHGVDLGQAWKKTVRAYLDDLRNYQGNYRPPEDERRELSEEMRYLSGLRDVENASLDRVERTRVFAGLSRQDLFRIGVAKVADGTITVRFGLDRMLQLASRQGWRVYVLSVNWSGAFIEGCLHGHGASPLPIVVANEVTDGGEICGPALLGHRLATSSDKADCLSALARQAGFSDGGTTVYVGDSVTDLACLCHPVLSVLGVAICGDAGSALMTTLSRVCVRVAHVGSPQDARVCWARDFDEILASKIMPQDSEPSSFDSHTPQ